MKDIFEKMNMDQLEKVKDSISETITESSIYESSAKYSGAFKSFWNKQFTSGLKGSDLLQFIFTSLCIVLGLALPFSPHIKSCFYVAGFISVGYEVLFKAGKKLFLKHEFSSELAVSILCLLSFSVGCWLDGVAVMFIYRLSIFIGSYVLALCKSQIQFSLQDNNIPQDLIDGLQHANCQTSIYYKIKKYTKYYLPLSLAFIGLFTVILWLISHSIESSLHRASMILITAAPFSLLICVPLFYYSTLFHSLESGTYVRSAKTLEKLQQGGAIVVKKDDVIAPDYKILKIIPEKTTPEAMIKICAHACIGAESRMARTIRNSYHDELSEDLLDKMKEYSNGLASIIKGVQVVIGTRDFMKEVDLEVEDLSEGYHAFYVAFNGQYAGCFVMSEKMDPEMKSAVETAAYYNTDFVMLSEDGPKLTKDAADGSYIKYFYCDCLPIDCIPRLEEIKEAYANKNVTFIGHVSTDEVLLEQANIGVSLHGNHSMACLLAGDAVILDNKAIHFVSVLEQSFRCKHKLRNYICASLVVKSILTILALLNLFPTLWFAMFIECLLIVGGILYGTDNIPNLDKLFRLTKNASA